MRLETVNIGRLISAIAAVLLVVGAAVFLLFRLPLSSEGLYKVKTAVGLEAATPERHVVPEDFKGWAVVHYSVWGAPQLREDDGAVILEYPANGRLETSTPPPDDLGFLHRGYYRRSADGLVPLSRAGDVWGEYSHLIVADDPGSQPTHSSGFFVGTMKEFRATEWPKEHGLPEVVPE